MTAHGRAAPRLRDRVVLRLLPPLALFRTVGDAGLLLPFLRYSVALWTRTGLDRQTRELVILRVAATEECDYELAQHVPLGRRAGLSENAIAAALRRPPPYPAGHIEPLDDEQRRALETTDAVCTGHRPLREGPEGPFDAAVALLAVHYLGVARLCRLLDLPPEAPASALAPRPPRS